LLTYVIPLCSPNSIRIVLLTDLRIQLSEEEFEETLASYTKHIADEVKASVELGKARAKEIKKRTTKAKTAANKKMKISEE
jgi:hypothetical protein